MEKLRKNWARSPEIIVARHMQDSRIPARVREYDALLKSQGSNGNADAFIDGGKVYLLSDRLDGPKHIAKVLFHEVLGHYGLRGAFGQSLTPILQQLGTMRRALVVAKARSYGLVRGALRTPSGTRPRRRDTRRGTRRRRRPPSDYFTG